MKNPLTYFNFTLQLLLLGAAAFIVILMLINSNADFNGCFALLQLATGCIQILTFLIMLCIKNVREKIGHELRMYALVVVALAVVVYIAVIMPRPFTDLILFSFPWLGAIYFTYLSYLLLFEKYTHPTARHHLDL